MEASEYLIHSINYIQHFVKHTNADDSPIYTEILYMKAGHDPNTA